MVDEKGEGNANYYAASEKEQHLTCVWFVKLNCNLAFFMVLCLCFLLLVGRNWVASSYGGLGLKTFMRPERHDSSIIDMLLICPLFDFVHNAYISNLGESIVNMSTNRPIVDKFNT